ncbi:MAG TPA: flagellar biosynthesis protein FlhB [Vicinamibacterales bacterium]
MAGQDRTERPTARRLQEARRRGQIARSQDLGHAAGLAGAVLALSVAGVYGFTRLASALARGLADVGAAAGHDPTAGEVTSIAVRNAATLGLVVGPVALAAAAAVVAAQVAQGGWNVASEALQPKLTRLNPIEGLKRLGLKRGGVQALKALAVVAIVVYLAYPFIERAVEAGPHLTRMTPVGAFAFMWGEVRGVAVKITILFAVLGTADYFWQKHLWLDGLKMTKQEVKDDLKMTEGSPEIKNRIRRVMVETVRRRMMAAVPKATVVVTNPTHYAVALQYERSRMSAPVVVAKGQGHLAQRIKAIAREHGVPMVENVPLAQALYKHVEVGQAIPANLFEAVAEVLAHLIRLRQLTLH